MRWREHLKTESHSIHSVCYTSIHLNTGLDEWMDDFFLFICTEREISKCIKIKEVHLDIKLKCQH